MSGDHILAGSSDNNKTCRAGLSISDDVVAADLVSVRGLAARHRPAGEPVLEKLETDPKPSLMRFEDEMISMKADWASSSR